jgi:cytochrome oxidase Cu insertion factor (SCO1/SenC/PrrC family)
MLSSGKVQRGLIGVLVALLAAIAVVIVVDRVQSAAGSTTATVAADDTYFDGNLLPDVKAANFTLTNQYGRKVTLSHDRGHVVVLTWIHSLCKDDCPFMVWQIKGALNDLPDHGRSVRVLGVSVDPGQDTPARRRTFVAAHEMTGRMQYVSGPLKAMRRVWKAYGIQPVAPKADHSAFVYLVSRHGYERVGFPAVQLTSSSLAHDIRRLQNGH